MAPGEGEAVVLVPVLEAEVVEGRGVGELQVCEVPVDDLAVARGEVDVARRVRVHLLQLRDQRLLLLRQPLVLLRRQVQLARLRPDEQSCLVKSRFGESRIKYSQSESTVVKCKLLFR